MKGWISLHRKIKEHWIWQADEPFTKRDAWIDLLLRATHSDKKFLHGNELITLDQGEFITSERKLSEQWQWSRTKVRSFLALLEEDGMITNEKTTHYTKLTICNYSDYQHSKSGKKTVKKPQKNQERTKKEPQKNTINNVNNDNNDNKKTLRQEILEQNSDAVEVADYLLEMIVYWKPSHRYKKRKHASGGWCQSIERAMRLDDRTKEQLIFVINYLFKQNYDHGSEVAEFWAKNIQSAHKLRTKFDRLVEDIKGEYKKLKKNGRTSEQQITDNARAGFASLDFDN